MKFVETVFLLALAVSSAAGVLYETPVESENRNTNGYNPVASDGVNEIREEIEQDANNGYITGDLISAGTNNTHKESEGRIINGYFARGEDFPYQAFLSIYKYGLYFGCGGSLISSEWVLTAAHCTYGAVSVDVYLGSTRRYAGTKFTVSYRNIIIHNGYYNTRNDISLIKIPAVNLNSVYIQPVRLPAISNDYSSYAGENVLISGWGRTSDTNIPGSNYLKWALVSVITNRVCSYSFGVVTSGTICASTRGGGSTCYGDSGGPMVLVNSRVLIGVTSFVAEKSCELGYPAGFVRVTSYLDWIKKYTGIYYT